MAQLFNQFSFVIIAFLLTAVIFVIAGYGGRSLPQRAILTGGWVVLLIIGYWLIRPSQGPVTPTTNVATALTVAGMPTLVEVYSDY